MYYLYVLLSKSKIRTYTGVTVDVERRLKEHNNGKVTSSRPYLPYEVIHVEACDSLKEARAKERLYKTTTGRRRLRDFIDRQQKFCNFSCNYNKILK